MMRQFSVIYLNHCTLTLLLDYIGANSNKLGGNISIYVIKSWSRKCTRILKKLCEFLYMLFEQHSFSTFCSPHFSSRKTIPEKEKVQTICIKSLEIRTRNVEADTFLTNTFAQLSVCMAAKFKCCGKTDERKIVTEPQGFCTYIKLKPGVNKHVC